MSLTIPKRTWERHPQRLSTEPGQISHNPGTEPTPAVVPSSTDHLTTAIEQLDESSISRLREFFELLDRWDGEQRNI